MYPWLVEVQFLMVVDLFDYVEFDDQKPKEYYIVSAIQDTDIGRSCAVSFCISVLYHRLAMLDLSTQILQLARPCVGKPCTLCLPRKPSAAGRTRMLYRSRDFYRHFNIEKALLFPS